MDCRGVIFSSSHSMKSSFFLTKKTVGYNF